MKLCRYRPGRGPHRNRIPRRVGPCHVLIESSQTWTLSCQVNWRWILSPEARIFTPGTRCMLRVRARLRKYLACFDHSLTWSCTRWSGDSWPAFGWLPCFCHSWSLWLWLRERDLYFSPVKPWRSTPRPCIGAWWSRGLLYWSCLSRLKRCPSLF